MPGGGLGDPPRDESCDYGSTPHLDGECLHLDTAGPDVHRYQTPRFSFCVARFKLRDILTQRTGSVSLARRTGVTWRQGRYLSVTLSSAED